MRRIAGIAAMAAVAVTLAAGAANADTKDKKIAFSNNYAGNSWRQAMLKSYDAVTKKAVADGVVAAADVFTTSENQVTEQAAQIQNLILQGYDAIVINAASPDALNGADQAGLRRRHHRRLLRRHRDRALRLARRGRLQGDGREGGRVPQRPSCPRAAICWRSAALPATSIDESIHDGIIDGVAKYPQFKIVGSVNGDWAEDVAQKAVAGILPSLPEVVGSRRSGRRRLWRGPGLQGRRAADARDHHGQPPGRARLVEGAEGRQRL